MELISILMVIAVVALLAYAILNKGRTVRWANIAEGVHANGRVTLKTDEAVASRYLLGRTGTDKDHVEILNDGEVPGWVIQDSAAAAEEPVECLALGCGSGTTKMVAADAIDPTSDNYVVAATSTDTGKVIALPATAGDYLVVGKPIGSAATDGDVIEVAHCVPFTITVTE